MSGPSARFLLLHALAVKGVATEGALVEITGLAEDAVTPEVLLLLDAELIRRRQGRLGGLALLDAGRAEHKRLLPADVREQAAAALASAYETFLPVNGRFKSLCTQWQLRGPEPNDHSDAAYDTAVIVELGALHAEAVAVLQPAADALPRMGRYPMRLGRALTRVQGGDATAFTKPLSESYHDVWMELHQDLLTSLGRTRDTRDEG